MRASTRPETIFPSNITRTGTKTEPWTPEQILWRARVSDAIPDARAEIALARSVALMGVSEASRRAPPRPSTI